ncbi:hypothetical protein [Streptomyces sp. NPDC095613]
MSEASAGPYWSTRVKCEQTDPEGRAAYCKGMNKCPNWINE